MKRNLLLVLVSGFILIAASSCSKIVIVPETAPLSGEWYLQSAERFDSYKWETINTGYESGIFKFHSNGDVSYSDALGELYGNWNMYPETSAYYDWNGNYRVDYHTIFTMSLFEAGNNTPASSWSFDDNNYNGSNRFKAIYTTNNYRYEYTFVRYQ